MKLIPTMIFAGFAACVLLADYALAVMLSMITEHGQFAISFEGMEKNIDLNSLLGEVRDGGRSIASLKLRGKKPSQVVQ